MPRQRILDRLGSGRRPKLVLIHAPAGYGKSTLASQWGQILTQQGLKGAWLAIDSDDNNAVWFLAHLIEAIRRTMPELADTLQQEFEGHLENTSQYVLNALINCRIQTNKPSRWYRRLARVTTETTTPRPSA